MNNNTRLCPSLDQICSNYTKSLEANQRRMKPQIWSKSNKVELNQSNKINQYLELCFFFFYFLTL